MYLVSLYSAALLKCAWESYITYVIYNIDDIEVVIHLGVIYTMRDYRIAGNEQGRFIRIINFPVP